MCGSFLKVFMFYIPRRMLFSQKIVNWHFPYPIEMIVPHKHLEVSWDTMTNPFDCICLWFCFIWSLFCFFYPKIEYTIISPYIRSLESLSSIENWNFSAHMLNLYFSFLHHFKTNWFNHDLIKSPLWADQLKLESFSAHMLKMFDFLWVLHFFPYTETGRFNHNSQKSPLRVDQPN